MKNSWREALIGLCLAALPVAAMFVLVVLPAFEGLRFSLGYVPGDNPAYSTGSHLVTSSTPTLEVYRTLLSSPFVQADLRLTLTVTLFTVLLILLVGYSLALLVRFGPGRLGAAVRSLYLIPMFVPVVIAAYAFITLYGSRGWLDALLHHVGIGYRSPIYGIPGIVMGLVWSHLPFATLLLGSGLDALPEEQVEAARDSGAGFLSILWRIILPLNLTPTMIVAAFSGISVLGSYTVPALLGPNAPQMVGVAMEQYFGAYRQPQGAVALAMITFALAAAIGALYVWGISRTRRHG
ncbi:MAG: ABC transporter permease subunit [Thermaceae bacterium]|nr:ABC transporter permease subunit [Thermaceae bacterium]